MSISEEVRTSLFKRAKGQCECVMQDCKSHSAGVRCKRALQSGNWDAHRRMKGGEYELGNLLALCKDCHENTRTFGQS